MYARTSTIRGNPQRMDDEIAFVRDEVMPALMTMPGCMGLSMLADRESGRCIVTTSWDSEEAMLASEGAVHDLRARAAKVMGATEAEVERWQIALLHRKHEGHDGTVARVVWSEGDPATADDNLSTMRTAVLPRMEELAGFCSMSLFIDRGTGRGAMTTTYDTRADMEKATEQAVDLRRQAAEAMGLRITDVAEFDVALHHLRVPETA
jgi:heme-degrading monooxygenase HmoA